MANRNVQAPSPNYDGGKAEVKGDASGERKRRPAGRNKAKKLAYFDGFRRKAVAISFAPAAIAPMIPPTQPRRSAAKELSR